MHTWYKAVCDEHKEMCDVLVTSTFNLRTQDYLGDWRDDKGNLVVQWLDRHYGCALRLVHLDTDLDDMWDTYKYITQKYSS
jgi:hypothetical protein